MGKVDGRLRIYRSTDGGSTWTRTGGGASGIGERFIRAAVRPDGALLIQVGLFTAESR